MKKLARLIFVSLVLAATLFAADSTQTQLPYNQEKYAMQAKAADENTPELQQTMQKQSAVKAALFSAILPGAGQVYAKSYWKAVLFVGIEAALWSVNYVYNGKAKDEDTRMRAFGDVHWSEQKYWSKIYEKAVERGAWNGSELHVGADHIILDDDYNNPTVRNELREMESAIGTHSLPTTKTQQYYEMIYKYLHQFGVGWDDAPSFDYYDEQANILHTTDHISTYRDMRDRSNGYYDVAGNMLKLVMVNHLASLFDAAWTVKSNNKKIGYAFRVKQQFTGYGYATTYGLNIIW